MSIFKNNFDDELNCFRGKFSKIFEDLVTLTLFTELTHINDETKSQNKILRPEVDVDYILDSQIPPDSVGV